jgi:hypothetical protein
MMDGEAVVMAMNMLTEALCRKKVVDRWLVTYIPKHDTQIDATCGLTQTWQDKSSIEGLVGPKPHELVHTTTVLGGRVPFVASKIVFLLDILDGKPRAMWEERPFAGRSARELYEQLEQHRSVGDWALSKFTSFFAQPCPNHR